MKRPCPGTMYFIEGEKWGEEGFDVVEGVEEVEDVVDLLVGWVGRCELFFSSFLVSIPFFPLQFR